MGLIVAFIASLFIVGGIRANAFRGTYSPSFQADIIFTIIITMILYAIFGGCN